MAVPDDPLVGRKKELADVLRLLLDDAVRLVTLTGPAGIGKSRLAAALAVEVEARGGAALAVVDGDGGKAEVLELLARPGGRVLATGLEPLGLEGEHVYRLRGLPEAPAIELYRQRAGPGLAASYDELAARCRRLGGNPRAIEREAVRLALASIDSTA